MKCPICKNELEIKNKKVGENEAGEAIFNEYGICRTCKKQWNLDKHRAKKAEAAQKKEEAPVKEEPVIEKPVAKPKKKKRRPVVDDATKVLDKLPSMEELQTPSKKPVAGATELKAEDTPVKEESVIERPVAPEPAKEVADEKPVAKPKKKKRRPAPENLAPAKEEAHAKKTAPVEEEIPSEKPKKKKRRPAPENLAPAKEEAHVKEEIPSERPRKKKRPVNPDGTPVERPKKVKQAAHAMEEPIEDFMIDLTGEDVAPKKAKKRKPIDNTKEEPAFSNIPPKHVREAREKEMRQNYQMMVDEDDDDERGIPTIAIVIIVILLLAVAAFAGYWFFLR